MGGHVARRGHGAFGGGLRERIGWTGSGEAERSAGGCRVVALPRAVALDHSDYVISAAACGDGVERTGRCGDDGW